MFQNLTVFENHRKVALNIASKASYVYILSEQKLTKNAKLVHLANFYLHIQKRV